MAHRSPSKNAVAKGCDSNSFSELFSKFCSSSTIHGTYFWSEARTPIARIVWGAIVLMGIFSATFIINSSFKAWQDHPVVTSVMQKSIEEIHFPAITLCPMDDTRMGVIEERLNKVSPEDFPISEIVTEILRLHFEKRPTADPSDCLLAKCEAIFWEETLKSKKRENNSRAKSKTIETDHSSCPSLCPEEKQFRKFFDGVKHLLVNDDENKEPDNSETYHKILMNRVQLVKTGDVNGSTGNLEIGKRLAREASSACLSYSSVSCKRIVADFRFLLEFETTIAQPYYWEINKNQSRPGTILKMLLSQVELSDRQSNQMFERFISEEKFPELYSQLLREKVVPPEFGKMSLPELVSLLANRHLSKEERERAHFSHQKQQMDFSKRDRRMSESRNRHFTDDFSVGSVRFGPDLLDTMKKSLHPPHLIEDGKIVSNAAFPFCKYDSDDSDGTLFKEYEDRYCNSFQTTFNEHGLCYTFNNVDQGMEERFYFLGGSEKPQTKRAPITLRKVTGCGRNRGFQLVVDSQQMMSLYPKNHLALGFKVFITMTGVVTSRVPFHVDPGFWGEHNFFHHGIHIIKSSDNFRKWNGKIENKMCYFPQDKNLSFFKHYSQDNCLLECRLKKISNLCNCAPWYMSNVTVPVCGRKGNRCFEKELDNYQDDLKDRKDCDCLNDCEMVHFFTTLQREPFLGPTAEVRAQHWFDQESGEGVLANYLLDPKNIFTDALSKNITKLAHNISTDIQLASERFRRDIAILNFYFDTPIITGITLELRTTVFDMISAVGGTLGLFTGISVITLVEVCYWSICFACVGLRRVTSGAQMRLKETFNFNFHRVNSITMTNPSVETNLQISCD